MVRISRRRRLIVLFLFVVVGVGSTWIGLERQNGDSDTSSNATPTLEEIASRAASQRPFSADSFWNTALGERTPTDPKSQSYVDDIERQIKKFYGTVGINTTQYTPSVYVVPAHHATVAVGFDDCQRKGTVDKALMKQWEKVPIPANAKPAKGTDGEMLIWQPSTDTIWEFWQAEKRADGWFACWGGRLERASSSQGIFTKPYGTTATGLSMLGGLIRIEELRAGRIDHAVSMALVEPKKGIYSWPANRSDGFASSESAVPEGQRFRLSASVDVDSLKMSKAGKTIARAIQKYGLVVRDKAGAVVLYAENPTPIIEAGQPNPYPALFENKQAYQVMEGFPWDKLEALPFDYGKR